MHGTRAFEHGHTYDKHSGRLLGSLYRKVTDDILASGPPAGAVVLDGGCGPGRILRLLADRRPDLVLHGADLADGMITEARAAAEREGLGDRLRFTQAHLGDLPYADDSFDLMVSSLSMHHWDDVARIVPELARVLKPTGRIRIYDVRMLKPEPFVTAATAAFPGARIERQLLRFGWIPISLVQVLTVTPADN